MPSPIRLAVLVSGGGRTLQNLADSISRGDLDAKIGLVVSSRTGAYGLERAAGLGIATHTVRPQDYPDTESFSAELFRAIRQCRPDLVCLAGWLCLIRVPDDFTGRVINIHPALLPRFGGKGMYGTRVHEAVLAAGCKESGCTVHFVDQSYDTGPIIVQRTCAVEKDDSPDTLAARVFVEECIAYPEAIRLIASGRARIDHSPQKSP